MVLEDLGCGNTSFFSLPFPPSSTQLPTLHLSPFPGPQKSKRQAARICTLCCHAPLTLVTGEMSRLQDTWVPSPLKRAQGPDVVTQVTPPPVAHSQVILCTFYLWLGFLLALCLFTIPNLLMPF